MLHIHAVLLHVYNYADALFVVTWYSYIQLRMRIYDIHYVVVSVYNIVGTTCYVSYIT